MSEELKRLANSLGRPINKFGNLWVVADDWDCDVFHSNNHTFQKVFANVYVYASNYLTVPSLRTIFLAALVLLLHGGEAK